MKRVRESNVLMIHYIFIHRHIFPDTRVYEGMRRLIDLHAWAHNDIILYMI